MDVVVTVPKHFWEEWIEEGDAAGEPETGELWGFFTWGNRPRIQPGERVYIVAHGLLRGYAPLTRLVVEGRKLTFGRGGGAVAVTIPEPIRGFQSWKYRWWDRSVEVDFPDWKTRGVEFGRPARQRKANPAPAPAGPPDLGPLFTRRA